MTKKWYILVSLTQVQDYRLGGLPFYTLYTYSYKKIIVMWIQGNVLLIHLTNLEKKWMLQALICVYHIHIRLMVWNIPTFLLVCLRVHSRKVSELLFTFFSFFFFQVTSSRTTIFHTTLEREFYNFELFVRS